MIRADYSPEVGIILPTYNSAKSLRLAVDSVLSQTYTNFRLVIIDNFSIDETEDLIKSYGDRRISYYLFRNNGIVAKSRNFGMNMLKCEYVALLDSDDFWEPTKLMDSVSWMNRGFDVVYHKMRIVYSSEINKLFLRRFLRTKQLSKPIIRGLLLGSSVVPNSSVMIRSNLITRKSMYLENIEFLACEDLELLLYLSLSTQKFKYINKTLGGYFVGLNNLSNRDMTMPFKAVSSIYMNYLEPSDLASLHCYIDYQKAKYFLSLNDDYNFNIHFNNILKRIKVKMIASLVLFYCRTKLSKKVTRSSKNNI